MKSGGMPIDSDLNVKTNLYKYRGDRRYTYDTSKQKAHIKSCGNRCGNGTGTATLNDGTTVPIVGFYVNPKSGRCGCSVSGATHGAWYENSNLNYSSFDFHSLSHYFPEKMFTGYNVVNQKANISGGTEYTTLKKGVQTNYNENHDTTAHLSLIHI